MKLFLPTKGYLWALIFLNMLCLQSWAQSKKTLDHDAYKEWRRIEQTTITENGKYIAYFLKSNAKANDILKLKDNKGKELLSYERGTQPSLSFDSKYLFFTIKHDLDSLKALKLLKTKKEELPKDSLAIYNIATGNMIKKPGLISLKTPEEWSGWIAYQYQPAPDTAKAVKKAKLPKGTYPLVIQSHDGKDSFEFPAVSAFSLSKKGGKIAYITHGDSLTLPGVYVFDPATKQATPAFRAKGKYFSLTWDEMGQQLAFVSDLDTTKARIRKLNLHLLEQNTDSASIIVNSEHQKLGDDWLVSEHFENAFSEDGSKLYFGLKTYPILQDTTLLNEDIVNVEVWSYTDQRLHTQQKIEKEQDLKKAYETVYHINNKEVVQLGKLTIPNIAFTPNKNHQYALGMNGEHYKNTISWEGFPFYNDLYLVNINSGENKLIKKKVRASGNTITPHAKYVVWYDVADSAWFSYSIAKQEIYQLTTNEKVKFYDEIHDTPSHPWPYGGVGVTENDEKLLIYDRWDIWEVKLDDPQSLKRITTDGREKQLRYRYVKLDDDEEFIKKGQKLLLTGFYHKDKSEALFELTYKSGASPKQLIAGDYKYGNFLKAQSADQLLFTQENFNTFPDLISTNLSFKAPQQVTQANPQQANYLWGSSELYNWTSLDGKKLTGLLIKPENFDPNKKYPLLVNFYEKNSDRLNIHRDPYPHRSTINYSFYASRGYVIFNPDIYYKDGYPGQSAYNCVISGITSLIEEGFIDKENIGVQGHSWGGYQVAYLVTKTDIFKCAEAGAPVPNMVSAYGGIRWWTGLSRMFQYEHTQSRIGGTLWDYPERYIENSPIFFIDKINTPVLIMHNDADGHVPWYQGIEFFVALRRLNKPSWMLNYQGEPHWPLKLQNRIDFSIRMQQYFDHYLKAAPKPNWMKEGVPAVKMGIDQGLDVEE